MQGHLEKTVPMFLFCSMWRCPDSRYLMPCIVIEAKWCPVAFPARWLPIMIRFCAFPRTDGKMKSCANSPQRQCLVRNPAQSAKRSVREKPFLPLQAKAVLIWPSVYIKVLGNIHSYVQKHLARGILLFWKEGHYVEQNRQVTIAESLWGGISNDKLGIDFLFSLFLLKPCSGGNHPFF